MYETNSTSLNSIYLDMRSSQEIHNYYQTRIDSLSFVLDQASELISSENARTSDSNTAIALNMLDSIARRMEDLLTPPSVH